MQAKILSKVEQLKAAQQGSTTTQASTLSATWKLLWTTEKETLFIVKNAPVFGTKAGGVYQASAAHTSNSSVGSRRSCTTSTADSTTLLAGKLMAVLCLHNAQPRRFPARAPSNQGT
jgi:hypothetical protein